jgi:hypothetical protein
MRCPRCDIEVQERFACTNCGQVIGKRCLMLHCHAINPQGAKYCGDCGYPLSISLSQWALFLGLRQRTIGHPSRNLVFFTTFTAAVLAYGVPVFLGGMRFGLQGVLHNFFSGQALLMILVAPPLLATYSLWITYPKGQWILATLIGIFGEYLFLIFIAALETRLSSFFHPR